MAPPDFSQFGILGMLMTVCLASIKYLAYYFEKRENSLIDKHEKHLVAIIERNKQASLEIENALKKQIEEFKQELAQAKKLLAEAVEAKHSIELTMKALEGELNLFRNQCSVCHNFKANRSFPPRGLLNDM